MNQHYVVHTAVNIKQTVKMDVIKMYTLHFYSAPGRGAEYCGEHVCLSVGVFVCVFVFVCLWNCMSDLHRTLCACYLWPCLGPVLAV